MSDLRITSGAFRGQTFSSPHDRTVHPMGSREKLALFNLLQPYLTTTSRVLDAYAGSGALGFEALSRGAAEVVFVEQNPKIAKIIAQNSEKLRLLPSSFKILTMAVEKAVNELSNERFDTIIADPPYNNFSVSAIELLAKLLDDEGILALSHPKTIDPPVINGIELQKTRTYAAATISIYRKIGQQL